MSKELFEGIFRQAMGREVLPLPYQERLATEGRHMPPLLDVPTGLGKTAAAVLAWLWRRRFEPEHAIRDQTPRRLVYCLPMRVLVEQTYREATKWLKNLGLWVDPEQAAAWSKPDRDYGDHPVAIHLLLGGEEKSDWALWPERDAILVGTQDMLLSRALNRGYSAGRARWPLEFGFLNNDCLWVFDEIQLMDTGLATSLQLDAWRRSLPLRSTRAHFPTPTENHTSKPCQSLWMSATMAQHWLIKAVDWSPQVETEWARREQLKAVEQTDEQLRSGQLFKIQKALHHPSPAKLKNPKIADKADAKRKQTQYLEQLASEIGKNRAQSGLTLVILNTVDRATELFKLLPKQSVPIKLIHSRFRPLERKQWREFLDQKDQFPRILVSTQVVEAGVDLSANVLYTELAAWASMVQRFGRCARYPGESGKVFWLDLDLGSDKQPVDHWTNPYERSELVAARKKLKMLSDVGLRSLAAIKAEIDPDPTGTEATDLFPYDPRFVPRDKDLFDLFDTTPDLTGADIDISRFIRDGDELDIQVFWRELSGTMPGKKDQPNRRELCPVPFHRFRDSLTVLRKSGRIWRHNYRKGWESIDPRDRDEIYPGQVYLLEKSCGGYSPVLGWTGDPRDTDFELPTADEPSKEVLQDDEDDADDLSQVNRWLNVFEHTEDVCKELDEILSASELLEPDRKILRLAARWHDRGKAHEVFQSKLKVDAVTQEGVLQKLAGQPIAKAPDDAWRKNGSRRGFRHELASALAILETLRRAKPEHDGFAWPEDLDRSDFDASRTEQESSGSIDDPLAWELAALSADELDLLVYLVAAHHGKVRMSIRSSPDDICPENKKQARGVRDGDRLPPCQLPSSTFEEGLVAPEVELSLDLMDLGLSPRYGASWQERMQLLLERLGPFRLAYLEGLLRAADCRASIKEDEQNAAHEAGG